MKKMILSALIVVCSVFGFSAISVASLPTNVSAQAANSVVKKGIKTATTADMENKSIAAGATAKATVGTTSSPAKINFNLFIVIFSLFNDITIIHFYLLFAKLISLYLNSELSQNHLNYNPCKNSHN